MFVSFTIPPRCFSSSFNILPNPLLPAPSADAFLNFAGKGLAQWGGSNGGGSSGWCRGGSRTLAATHIFTIIVCTCAFLCTAELNYTDVSFMKTLQMWAAFHHNVSSASSSWDAAEQQCTNLWTWKKSPVRSIKVSTALPRHPQAGSTDQPSLTRRSTSSLDSSNTKIPNFSQFDMDYADRFSILAANQFEYLDGSWVRQSGRLLGSSRQVMLWAWCHL